MQRGVDVDELANSLQRPIIQLAVEGTSGLPVLENLAADPRFRGTVVVSIAPAFSFNRKLSKLASEYMKLKSKNAVLKKAVILAC